MSILTSFLFRLIGKKGGRSAVPDGTSLSAMEYPEAEGKITQAKAYWEGVLDQHPDNFDALLALGTLQGQSGNSQVAADLLHRATQICQDNLDAYNNLGNVLMQLQDYAGAVASYGKAVELDPANIAVILNRSDAYCRQGDLSSALAGFEAVVRLDPDCATAYLGCANVRFQLGQFDEAGCYYDKALEKNSALAEAFLGRGNVYRQLRRYADALSAFETAISLRDDSALFYSSRGMLLFDMKHYQEALESFDKAIDLDSKNADYFFNRGVVFFYSGDDEAAIYDFEKSIQLGSRNDFVFGLCLYTQLHICDWRNFENQKRLLECAIMEGTKSVPPFALHAMSDNLLLHRKVVDKEAAKFVIHKSDFENRRRNRAGVINIGYFSPDFRTHPVSFQTAELFEKHDRRKFKITAFSFGGRQDGMTKRVAAAFDDFIDVAGLTDQEIVALARHREIDIAVDLAGYTGDSRAAIFAIRAAPIQVGYIGFLGTMGSGINDYLIADSTIVPEQSRVFYAEKIAYLPCYQANDSRRQFSSRVFSRAELGLPERGFVYCCFNGSYKVQPETFDSWMRILQRNEDSVLLLYAGSDIVVDNLGAAAKARGVDPKRLVFAQRLPFPEYLARYRVADLFLDTLPYNAGSTASDALWAGLPVLTCCGESFASRIGASLLNALDLPELIAYSRAEYENCAVALASAPNQYSDLRRKLMEKRQAAELFDTPRFVANIEKAYIQMHERYQAGAAPEHIYVQ